MKTIMVVGHNLGRLANQLWQYISVYAYALEKGYRLENLAFFEYSEFFPYLPHTKNIVFFQKLNSFFSFFSKKYGRYITYMILNFYILFVKFYYGKRKKYISNWLFRYPKGLIIYRKQILQTFLPRSDILKKIDTKLISLRQKYKKIIGVHIRQGDYKTKNWKKLYFTNKQIASILNEALSRLSLVKNSTCFILCSDGPIDPHVFFGLHIFVSKGTTIEDLFLLSKTNIIIGSDSTYPAFASYYGNIPYIVFHKKIDWEYYADKKTFFENKYNTTVHFDTKVSF